MSFERAERFTDDLIPSVIIGYVVSFALYEFFTRGATVANGLLGNIEAAVAMLFIPGLFISALVGGNIHDYSLGLAFLINGLIYSVVLLCLFKLRRRFSRAKSYE